MTIPQDYLERVYAGVLGKLIGVFLGRPFEQWTHQRIMRELGPIEYYVHERLGEPLIVTDDDVAGTFTFVRALEDYGVSPDLSAEDIGKAWLNYIVEEKSILWWGGNGNSTEHTAWINLKNGIAAPHSGSIATNGSTVAEQIGAQIFIDGWALVSPCRPELAARLAKEAGSVSHDGESVYAAMLWAAMEAEAFRSSDIDHLLDVGLSVIPPQCLIARMIADIRQWCKTDGDWLVTRQRIEDQYGYAQYPGNCHVVPNHALMIMAVLYAPDDFQRAQMIVNTAGWDTDCNAGNVGCLMGIMLGLDGIDAGPDFRGPVADRMLISSADGGNSINDAVRVAYYLANLGLVLAGQATLEAPKSGAQFHFSLRGSRQGFRPQDGYGQHPVSVDNVEHKGGRALAMRYEALGPGQSAAITTPVFTPREVVKMKVYDLMATPLVYPGQVLRAAVAAGDGNIGDVEVRLRIRVYDEHDALRTIGSDAFPLSCGQERVLEWRIPDLGGQPIAEIGLAVAARGKRSDGEVIVDYVRWDGAPELELRRPEGEGTFWRMAWVNGVSFFSKRFPPSFRISQDRGDGIIIHGTRQWTDYKVESTVMLHLGTAGGLAARVQGLRRYYAVRLVRTGSLQIVRVRDEVTTVLAETAFPVTLETKVNLRLTVEGQRIVGSADGLTIEARDDSDNALASGGIGLVVSDGAISTPSIRVSANKKATEVTSKEFADVVR
ncbi:ADP-ribosylglycohydrolase family protein [Sinorhizobium medicae]|uniref:ADP-ribosylglycohydrolase family protein n=1 Tax=Sinorhizobium medicae TaxID=110321 RepID=UPI0011AAF1D4|nr:ADP-ribosylglycohydrolase family protein [Sinorhizobium medicae]MDX0524546.1 ADP-ribosylglycohydrolase family protein [Sinorhizobium medicae]MDX0635804.1 ADP-ribosylglycohydrolase family protein [Sinorhizobium medicae]MDX0772275.1 ADP-ribosylglycohydrolase family protein [Sinorhizobium medicae]MDX0907087.1 ADP-ribosylglycohydrolase family protein [Sinorhizobium medicae]MDX1164621.1 ADP-ribosylglycohydrolase family protein [Sinorhizobium medicae]